MCTACHTLEPNQMGGYFESAAFKSLSMQIDVGTAAPQILRFDPKALKVIDAGVEKTPEHLREVKKRHEVQVTFVEKDGVKVASEVRFKGPAKIDPANLIDYAGVAKLVAEGPAKTPYTLIDSRPLVRFQEGAIPTAIHLPFIGFDKFVDRLPKDKDQLVVFYCGGVTCTLSPNSLKKAKLLGYTNLRVYREGEPEWKTRNYLVTTPAFVKAAYVDRDIPHVMIDARAPGDATSGHIKGAVSVPAGKEAAVLKSLPPAKLNAPLIVYDGRGGEQAVAVANALVKAGQQNVMVLNEGMIGWQAAAYPIESGTPALTQDRLRAQAARRFDPDGRVHHAGHEDAGRRADPRRAQSRRGLRRHDQGCAADSRRGTGRTHGRGAQGQAHRHALPDRHPRRDGLPQAQGSGLQGRVPEQRHRGRQGRQLQDHAALTMKNGEGLRLPRSS